MKGDRLVVPAGWRSDSDSLNLPGVIKTALANMDREMKSEYQVLLQAKDMGGQLGGLASTTTINITISDVNDNPPRFSKSKTVPSESVLLAAVSMLASGRLDLWEYR